MAEWTKIKEYRKGKGFSQKYMAEKLNVSISSYQKIEQGIMVLSVERFLDICRILEINSYNDLLPSVSADIVERVEKVLNENTFAFNDINNQTTGALRLIRELTEKVENGTIDKKETLELLDYIETFISLIKRLAHKESYGVATINDLKEKID